MNHLDFEKTQLFTNKAKEARIDSPSSSGPPSMPSVSPPPVKPVVKKLSKEEKILLATGGVLTLGLGAIVIVSMTDDDVVPVEAVNAPQSPIQAPIIETENATTPEKPVVELPTSPVVHEPKHTKPHQSVHDNQHALIDIPDELTVATKVTDDMSFDDAFKTARTEVGPGGLFVWNDTYYGTFNEREWENLPEAKKNAWIGAVEPIIDPHVPEEASITGDNHVIIADRGEIIWTGIDKDGDGIAEVLTARVQGQSPIVMIDNDKDGKLDTRYFLNSATGKVTSTPIEQTRMEMKDINEIPQIEAGSSFFITNDVTIQDSAQMPVTILEENGAYMVGIDLDNDALVDIISLNKDGENPVVAMDMDNDGRIETSFIYDADQQMVVAMETEPMESMIISEQAEFSEEAQITDNEDSSDDDDTTDGQHHNHHTSNNYAHTDSANEEDTPYEEAENAPAIYFNHESEAADDFVA